MNKEGCDLNFITVQYNAILNFQIQLRNLDSGKVTVFPCDSWFSKGKTLSREVSASVGGRSVLKPTIFTITVKTSDARGSGTNANVFLELFGMMIIFVDFLFYKLFGCVN